MLSKFQYLINIAKSRQSYPLHLNLMSMLSFFLGGIRSKINYDNFRLPHYAFGILESATRAKALGIKEITVIEFGVANGRGLMAMALYASKIEKETGIKINVVGFDSGVGMPATQDYRDHPELYATGDFPLQNRDKLLSILPSNTKLVILDLITSNWTEHITKPIAFFSMDVDYYSSTIAILQKLSTIRVDLLMPNTLIYFDDVLLPNHNPFQGELLAIDEFNSDNKLRKIVNFSESLRSTRILKHAQWIKQMFQLHVLDHTVRNVEYRGKDVLPVVLPNKYLKDFPLKIEHHLGDPVVSEQVLRDEQEPSKS